MAKTEKPAALQRAGAIGVLTHSSDSIAASGRRGILVVSFGTTYADSRAKTIDVIACEITAEFPEAQVVSALSSHIVVRRIKEQEGIEYPTPEEGLRELLASGVTEVAIVPTALIPGIEYGYLRELFYEWQGKFARLTLGTSLLYHQGQEGAADDVRAAMAAVAADFPECFEMDAVLLMAHGTPHPANAYHATMQLALWDMGERNAFVYTVEGTPTIEQTIAQLQRRGIRHVTLLPLMLVAGDHAHNDMAEHRAALEAAGFEVETVLRGIGESERIRSLYLAKAHEAWTALTEN